MILQKETALTPIVRIKIKVARARGFHLFPFRTEKLSPSAPMVLRKRESRSLPPFFLLLKFKRPNGAFFVGEIFRRLFFIFPVNILSWPQPEENSFFFHNYTSRWSCQIVNRRIFNIYIPIFYAQLCVFSTPVAS